MKYISANFFSQEISRNDFTSEVMTQIFHYRKCTEVLELCTEGKEQNGLFYFLCLM